MKSLTLLAACAALASAPLGASAQAVAPAPAHSGAAPAPHGAKDDSPATYWGVGVVRKVDAAQGKVILQHEPIESLGWPAMTMAFRVKDREALAALTPGRKVRFAFVHQARDYVITSLQ